MSQSNVSDDLAVAFEYAYLHEDWITPVDEALEGIGPVQAAWRRAPEAKSIWEIVLHVAVWNENVIERISTGQRSRPAEGSWPPLPETLDSEAWQAAKLRLRKSLDNLVKLLRSIDLSQIQSSPYGIPDLICRYTHVGYHIGQITILKEYLLAGDRCI